MNVSSTPLVFSCLLHSPGNTQKKMSPPEGLVGSLTSEFTPPATCLGQGIQTFQYYISDQTHHSMHFNHYLTVGPGAAACFPSNKFPYSGSYYSPGRCPSGYSAACTTTGENSVDNAIETTVTCCPLIPYSFKCNTKPIGGDWGAFTDCITSTSTLEVDQNMVTNAVINAYGIEVRWQQTDEAILFSITSSSTVAPSTSHSNLPTMTDQTESSLNRNAGTIAGIVVGSVAAVLILIGILVMVARLKRKRRLGVVNQKPASYNKTPYEAHTGVIAELAEPDRIGVFPKYELPTPLPTGVIPRQELSAEPGLMNRAYAAQDWVDYQKDLQGGVNGGYLAVIRELEA
ncbi:hypothetical protein F5Y03DRAFT_359192 [Xylaria venustula]|nr:hypothetical protein F5Y03DRAFT_359192 [Xylaria venustula]